MSDQTKKPVYINRENFTDKIKSYLRHPGSMILMFLVMFATFITDYIRSLYIASAEGALKSACS